MITLGDDSKKEPLQKILDLLRATQLNCLNENCVHNSKFECVLRKTLLSKKGRCLNFIGLEHLDFDREREKE